MRTVPYDTSRDALYRPHLAPSIFPVIDLSDDLLCAESSRLAYKHFERTDQEKSEVDEALRSVGFEEVEYFNQGGAQAFAAWSSRSQTAVVAFRGTEQDDPTDLDDDLHTRPVSWRKGKVHQGFQSNFERIWQDRIDLWIDEHPGRLLLTGHSLGAALGTLAASLRKPEKLITFGSPRVGDSEFLESLSGVPIFRYVDCCDVVTQMPPALLGFGHLEPMIYIDRLGQVTKNATAELIRQDAWTARGEYLLHDAWRTGSVAVRDLADHAPINYVYALRGALP